MPRIAVGAGLFLLVALGALDWVTLPPLLPDYGRVRATWTPSESWLYDRHGQLIDSARVDFQVRRLAWTPLAEGSPGTRETLVSAEDRRFSAHGGVDWWALGGALRDRLEGRHARGASTLSMQVAAF